MSRPKHRYPDYERLLKEVERRPGWTVEGGGDRHFKIKCPNPCKCMTPIPTTPSKRQSLTILHNQMAQATCWREAQ